MDSEAKLKQLINGSSERVRLALAALASNPRGGDAIKPLLEVAQGLLEEAKQVTGIIFSSSDETAEADKAEDVAEEPEAAAEEPAAEPAPEEGEPAAEEPEPATGEPEPATGEPGPVEGEPAEGEAGNDPEEKTGIFGRGRSRKG